MSRNQEDLENGTSESAAESPQETVDSGVRTRSPRFAGNVVLLVSDDAVICEVMQAPDAPTEDLPAELKGLSVDVLGIDGLTEFVRENVQRALKGQAAHSEELQSDQGFFELIFIAQAEERALLIVRNISDQRMAIARVRHLAYLDEPTGLPNREFLLAELGRITDDLRLSEGRAAVISFDIDKLDLPGYAEGSHTQDTALKVLARRLVNGLRSINRSQGGNRDRYTIAARIDFRKLSVVLPEIETGSEAAAVAQRLADSLQKPISIENKSISVTVCAGIALFPQDGTDAISLFENSLTAMEDAKRSQSGPQKFHTGTARVKALQRQDMELELRSALHRDELELHYLPVLSAETREVVSVEALLRWPQTTFGAQSIQRVVALAEHTGLIVPIGEWVLHQTCEQLRDWHSAGLGGLRLAVNLSLQEFSRPDLPETIENILSSYSIRPDSLDCEITEHMLFRDAMRNFATSRKLKELGVGIIVDDYGTGVCTLANLAHSPVDAVKIDNSFVANAESQYNDRAACAAATAMAHELGMRIIAEGVETTVQAELLHAQGCDYLQGFLFCKPSPAAAIGDYIHEHMVVRSDGEEAPESAR